MTNTLTPVNTRLVLTNLDTQYSWTPPASTAYFTFQCRTAVDIRFAFTTGLVATPTEPYMTLKSGQAYNSPERGLLAPGTIVYFAGDAGGEVVEITYWTQVN